jgi:SAM-dependent methyltransferase
MKSRVKDYLIKQMFEPNLLGVFVNPFYIARKNLLVGIKAYGKMITGKTLDIGCGSKPYEKHFSSTKYLGLEIETQTNLTEKKADFYYDGKTFPFENQSFDSAISNQVLEHVFTPNDFLSEVHRILKSDGLLLITVPFVWDEHEQPYDYARYSSFGLKYLLESNGFEIIKQNKLGHPIEVILQLINDYIYKITKDIPIIKQLTTLFVSSLISVAGVLLSKILPSNQDLFLDNIILAKKVSNV